MQKKMQTFDYVYLGIDSSVYWIGDREDRHEKTFWAYSLYCCGARRDFCAELDGDDILVGHCRALVAALRNLTHKVILEIHHNYLPMFQERLPATELSLELEDRLFSHNWEIRSLGHEDRLYELTLGRSRDMIKKKLHEYARGRKIIAR